jgi:hypothetical protein
MLWQWKQVYGQWGQGTGDVVAVGAGHTRCYGNGNMATDQWEQGTEDVVAVGIRHRKCCCCGNKAQEMLPWEQGIRGVMAKEIWPVGTKVQ